MSIARNHRRIERRRMRKQIAAAVQERQCGGCTECCRVLGVPELHKGAWTSCPHASVAVVQTHSRPPDADVYFHINTPPQEITPSVSAMIVTHQRTTGQVSCGCGIYATRPESCRKYLCAWRQGYGTDAAPPNVTGVVIDIAVPHEDIGVPRVLVWRSDRPNIDELTKRERKRLASVGIVSVLVSPDGDRLLTGPPQSLDKVLAFMAKHPV